MMQLMTVRYVIAVAELGSFTKAAEQLYVSQPALSQAIARLERDLKVSIFRRDHNTVTLTPAGQILVDEGRRMLELEKNIRLRLSDLSQAGTGSLVLGAAPSYQRYYLSWVISTFQSKYPNVKITLQESYSNKLCGELRKGRVDIALICEPFPEGMDVLPVFQEEIFLALPPNHPLVKQFPRDGDPYPMADLSLCRDEPFITFRPGRRITDIVLRATAEAGFRPKILTECLSTESANTMIHHGFGVGLIPSTTVKLCPEHQHARYYRLRPGGLMRQFALARRSGGYSSRAQSEFFRIAEQLNWDWANV